ncbi:hypothetical protein AWB71_06018 [Caballeronia peredens]|nr:hypothetical protein AWB71_06018 [Caballeronia peredens]
MSSYEDLKKALEEAIIHECLTERNFHLLKVIRMTMHGHEFELRVSSKKTSLLFPGSWKKADEGEIRSYHADNTYDTQLLVSSDSVRFTPAMYRLIAQERLSLNKQQYVAFANLYRQSLPIEPYLRSAHFETSIPSGLSIEPEPEMERDLSSLFTKKVTRRTKPKRAPHLIANITGRAVELAHRIRYRQQATLQDQHRTLYSMRYQGMSQPLYHFLLLLAGLAYGFIFSACLVGQWSV